MSSGRLAAMIGVAVLACAGGAYEGPTGDGAPEGACPECTAPNQCCAVGSGWMCLATTSEMDDCGGCGAKCDRTKASQCVDGQCRCVSGPLCGDSTTCCPGGLPPYCKDLESDPKNCGGCGQACGPGQTCENGHCQCGASVCAAGMGCCLGVCTDIKTDEKNCGACGTVCSGASSCEKGVCGCAGEVCPEGGMGTVSMCCAAGCTDVCMDAANCGGCGTECALGMFDQCLAGSCISASEWKPMSECVPF